MISVCYINCSKIIALRHSAGSRHFVGNALCRVASTLIPGRCIELTFSVTVHFQRFDVTVFAHTCLPAYLYKIACHEIYIVSKIVSIIFENAGFNSLDIIGVTLLSLPRSTYIPRLRKWLTCRMVVWCTRKREARDTFKELEHAR